MERSDFPYSSAMVWDDKPSPDWADAYPLGSGRLGAMVFGNPLREIIPLNHDLLWRDYLRRPVYRTCRDMPEIRRLCGEGKYREADLLLCRTVPSRGAVYIGPFVPACDLYLGMAGEEKDVAGYCRLLNLETGVVTVLYRCGGVSFRRDCFCSEADGVFVLHIAAECPGTITGELSLSRLCEPECETTGSAGQGRVSLRGEFEEGKRFAAEARILNRNGRLTGGKKTYGIPDDVCAEKKFGLGYVFSRDEMYEPRRGASACFDSCDEVTVVVAVATDDESGDPEALCRERAGRFSRPYEEALREHEKHFSAYFNRMKLDLGEESDFRAATPELVRRSRESGVLSPALAALLFHMGRYLAVASGMPVPDGESPKAPINLQGVWCRDHRPAWESDYHTDLNIEMCYWPLPELNLCELSEPLLRWVERLMPQARECARDLYGCTGAAFNGCCGYKTLGGTDNVGAAWLGGAAWLAQVLYLGWKYGRKTEYLRRLYPIMEEFEQFYGEILTEKDGRLAPPFGSSPEMPLKLGGRVQWLSSASSIDLQLIRELYVNLLDAGKLLGEGPEKTHRRTAVLDRLELPPIGADGCLQEWTQPHGEEDPGHRHRSPFVGLCPGDLYSPETSPEYAEAAYRLLKKRQSRGNGMSTSFSYAWDAQILARLYRGDEAFQCLGMLPRIHLLGNLLLTANDWSGGNGGIAWFPGVKVVQAEASIETAAALEEMIFQDRQGTIRLLPALPRSLAPRGSLTGIRGRNGFECGVGWENGKVSSLRVVSLLGENCRVGRSGLPPVEKIEESGRSVPFRETGDAVEFETSPGGAYEFVFAAAAV